MMCVCRLYCLSRVRPVKLLVVGKLNLVQLPKEKHGTHAGTHAGTHTRTHAHTHAHVPLPIYVHDSALGHARNVSPINSLHLLSVLCSPRLYLLVVM